MMFKSVPNLSSLKNRQYSTNFQLEKKKLREFMFSTRSRLFPNNCLPNSICCFQKTICYFSLNYFCNANILKKFCCMLISLRDPFVHNFVPPHEKKLFSLHISCISQIQSSICFINFFYKHETSISMFALVILKTKSPPPLFRIQLHTDFKGNYQRVFRQYSIPFHIRFIYFSRRK